MKNNKFKRFLASLLVLCMMIGLVPANAIPAKAAEEKEVVDAAIFFSDLHAMYGGDSSEGSYGYKKDVVTNMMTALKDTGLNFSSVTSVGDAFSSNEKAYTGKTSVITGYIRDALDKPEIPVNYTWSDHDRAALAENDKDLLENKSGLIYGAGPDGVYGNGDDGNYYVYAISHSDTSSAERYSQPSTFTTQKLQDLKDAVKPLDPTKPIFIASHQPLLARRSDNQYAYQWCTAINEIAETRDVAFFFGHNHKYDQAGDYYCAKGDELTVQNGSGSKTVELNFTHMCAGYLNPSTTGSAGSSRQGTVMVATIYDDEINYTTYCATGKYTASNAVNKTVKRDWAAVEEYELSKIEVTDVVKDTYYVGEKLENPVVKATYTKEGSADDIREIFAQSESVSDGYTLSGYDMSKAGKQTVVVSYKDKTASFEITVEERVLSDESTGVSIADKDNNITSVEVTAKAETVEGYDAYVSYDIVPEGYVTGTEVEVTIPVDTKLFDVERPVQVIDEELGTIQNSFIKDGKVTFTATHFSVYSVAQRAAGEPTTVEGLVATSVSNTSTTTVDNNSYYLVKNNRNGLFLTGVPKTGNTGMLNLEGTANRPALAANNIWYFSNVSGTNYNVQYKSPSGQYLTIGSGTAGVTDTATNVNVTYDNANGRKCFDIAVGNYHLNNYEDKAQAAGYTSGTSDAGSRWQLYKVTTAPAALTVNESALGMYVGDAKNLTASATANNKADDGAKITWESSNDAVVTVNDEGQVVAVGAGTAELTAILASVSEGSLLAPVKVTIPVQVNTFVEGTTIEITHKDTEEIVNRTLVVKNVEENSTYKFDYLVFEDGIECDTKPVENIEWLSSDEEIATVENGVVTYHGKEGIVRITVVYKYDTENNENASDSIVISVSKGNYMVPSDGTNDFPEYPNEGSVRFDKTATAVGNFSETGIAQLELSMTGVPSTTENKMDIVVMLDRSSSMPKATGANRIENTIAATEAFIRSIVTNEDGSYNGNRIVVYDFLGGNPAYNTNQHKFQAKPYTRDEDDGYQIIDNEEELTNLFNSLEDKENGFIGQENVYGTDYANGLKTCYEQLLKTQNDGNQQFCVFMSDGIPNAYQGETTYFDGTTTDRSNNYTPKHGVVDMFKGTNSNTRDTDYEYEHYSSLMKKNGVTVYTVGLGLENKNSSWSGGSATACLNVASILLNDISGPAKELESNRDTGSDLTKKDKYFFNVVDSSDSSGMVNAFDNIAKKILEAAKNVKVTDKIADEYTMIFDVPEGPEKEFVEEHLPANQEFYIEFLNYTLKPVVEQGVTTNYLRDQETSLMKLYLAKDEEGNYFAAKDSKGTPFATPVFAPVPEGQDGYYNLVGEEYVFTPNGTGKYNMVSGARASGTTNNTLVIETPYVHYEAENRILVWTAEKLSSSELALRYFLYLNKSAAEKVENQVDAGTYPTNDWATLNYTNFQGNDCEQIFPIPQMTWNGAQVSYVFYLVNDAGKPVNRAGRVVPFSEAVYVTDVFNYAVTWNRNDASAKLEEELLAKDKVPDVYELYDKTAGYNIYVYEEENGKEIYNHFDIEGTSREADTTYVFNTKSDVTKYKRPGTYTANGKNNTTKVHEGFDFSNTTVAFAVLWKPELKEDTVVIDYGLPVDIDVAKNDAVTGEVKAVFGSNARPADVDINTGQISNRIFYPTEINPDGMTGIKYGKAEVLNGSTVRYTPTTMEMTEEDVFYYVTELNYWQKDENGIETLQDSRMYSSVTVIPATTVYYEDNFVDFKSYKKVDGTWETEAPGTWGTDGTTVNGVQDTDRPGIDKVGGTYDADNAYGYDSAYTNMSTHSMGSARKITVDENTYGTAEFEFYGTGFDIISSTSNDTGTITVKVENVDTKEKVRNMVVDTYYGYTKTADGKWVVSEEERNQLYQIPVMEVAELPYGHYKVTIKAAYNKAFDHKAESKTENNNKGYDFTYTEYDMYIDAIRIYDPTGVVSGETNEVVSNAYKADGEAWPVYVEVRNELISKSDFGSIKYDEDKKQEGAVFVENIPTTDADISDYENYGPNNEVYLQKGQAIAFKLDLSAFGNIVEDVQIGLKGVEGNVTAKVYDAEKTELAQAKAKELSTATGMYYSIKDLKDGTIVICNTSESDVILSVTDIKVTFTEKPSDEQEKILPRDLLRSSGAMFKSVIKSITENPKVLSVATDKDVYKTGETVTTTVTTNAVTSYVTVNGEKVTEYAEDGDTKIWTIETKSEKAGKLPFAVVAYNEVEEATEETMKEVDVADFVPTKFSLSLNKKNVIVGEKIKATVTTSTDVKYVRINGKKVTKYTYSKSKGTRTWTLETKAKKTEEMTFTAVAYDKKGKSSVKLSATATAKKFEPKQFDISMSKKYVKKGQKYTVTVTTSTDVKYVKVNGKKIKKYTSSKSKGTRTFKVTYKALSTGNKKAKVYAYNKNGSVSALKIEE